jgi:trimethylamine--corrinoid protein Co-methyltransferase
VQQVDETARRVLAEIGLRIFDADYLDLLERAGARVDRESMGVRFPRDWLAEALSQAPRQFVLHSRGGTNDVSLGDGGVHFASGGRVFRILDPGSDTYRPTTLRDVARTAALVDRLEHIDLYIIACQAQDVGPEHYHLNDFFQAFNHTTKHVMGGCDSPDGAREMWELAAHIAGGADRLREAPFVSVIVSPMSPLILAADSLRTLDFCGSSGIPVVCAPAPIAGATAPATLAGTLSLMHAEALATVAIAQVLTPGAKVLYGAGPSTVDLRSFDYTMGSVEMALMNAAAVQLADLNEVPIYASGGVTESKLPDVQAGSEKGFSLLLAAMCGPDLLHLAAGMLDSGNAVGYEQYVIDNEILGMVKRALTGIRVDEDALGFDVIRAVGPGGSFAMEDHTVEHMLGEFFYPNLSVRRNFDAWVRMGHPGMVARAGQLVAELLGDAEDGLLDDALVAELEERFELVPLT